MVTLYIYIDFSIFYEEANKNIIKKFLNFFYNCLPGSSTPSCSRSDISRSNKVIHPNKYKLYLKK